MNFNVNSFLAQGEQQRATYRDERRAEEKELIERQDAGIFEITGNPEQYIQYLEQKVARLEKRAARDSWRERFRAPFMGKDMKQGRLNPLPWSEKNVEK